MTGYDPEPGTPTAVTVTPGDSRYPSLLEGYNHRFTPAPAAVALPATTAQVVDAVEKAVAAGGKIAVRSGGHCFEDFAAAPDTATLLDMSCMDGVWYDRGRRAFCVEAGATLGKVYSALFRNWGVTIPGGNCLDVGMGGHVPAGGYGHLSRRDGLVVDHLYAVEVVVVDDAQNVTPIVATREPDDPHRELWWALTGAGGGNFGVVTRFWMRTPDAPRHALPEQLLPAAPGHVRRRDVLWSWDSMTEADLTTLLRNYGAWFEHNSAPGSRAAQLWSNLIVTHRSSGVLGMTTLVDEAVDGAAELLDEQFRAFTAGMVTRPTTDAVRVEPWYSAWLPSYSWPGDPHGRYKHKAAYLRSSYSEEQLAATWHHLTRSDYANPAAGLVLTAFGGRVDDVASDATATAQRDSILKANYTAGTWLDPAADDEHLAWVREYYHDVYAGTGGVPVPDGASDGSYIGYPDVDLADPAWNTSGVPWSTLYFKDNYPRLQQVKQRYDPADHWRHTLSVRLPG